LRVENVEGIKTSSEAGNWYKSIIITRARRKTSMQRRRSVNQVSDADTLRLDADDFTLPAFEPEPELVLEFDFDALSPVPEPELLPETVSSPEISEKKEWIWTVWLSLSSLARHRERMAGPGEEGRRVARMALRLVERGQGTVCLEKQQKKVSAVLVRNTRPAPKTPT
jgi:hypothetical protein